MAKNRLKELNDKDDFPTRNEACGDASKASETKVGGDGKINQHCETDKYQYDTPVKTIGDTNYYKTGKGYDAYDEGDLLNYVTTKPSELLNLAAESGSAPDDAEMSNSAEVDQSYNSAAAPDGFTYEDAPTYTDHYDQMLQEWTQSYLKRGPFSYDYTQDPLYGQYADAYTRAGNRAMQDTLGQVSARTGGLASSYATAAAQGTYGNYMQALADKVPELYQLAYSMYQDEGNRQLQTINLLQALESGDYQKYLNVLSQHNTNRAFDYGVYTDERAYAANQAQQTLENRWYEEQIARGINKDALQMTLSSALSQTEWLARKARYKKTGVGGANVANYDTYFDYMTAMNDYYTEQLSLSETAKGTST